MKIGFTIGKFAPFHKGHQLLIETGIKEMEEFYVVVYDTNLIDIPSKQMEYLIKIIDKISPTHFYSSEPYGEKVAEYMNIIDRRVDTERVYVPIRGSSIRKNIENNRQWISDIVYIDLKKESNNE